MDVPTFIAKWKESGSSERANKDSFVHDFCEVLGVPHPAPKTGDSDRDRYVFEREVVLVHGGERQSIGFMDLFKDRCFILEAKQFVRRDTPWWNMVMQKAYGQALTYATTVEPPPPFLIVTDIGYCFDVYASFDGSRNYRKFPDALTSRIALESLTKPENIETLRTIFLDPYSLDPSKRTAKVTREIAGHVASLARSLESASHEPEKVAKFLMRCLFTMFAEDVELLPKGIFADALEHRWLEHPELFPTELEDLWRRMNEGGYLFGAGKIWQFNGGLFADPVALPLTKEQLWILGYAAKSNWSDVEPAIFGTLLERALDPKERHRLGAHFTPRAYVERLVRPTIEEPLRAEWDNIRAQVLALVSAEDPDKNIKAVAEARKIVYAFYDRLTRIRVLDPACGSGNFLYVSLDLFKRIENEVLDLLANLGEDRAIFNVFGRMVTPEQFLGIEIKPWAKEITELVLWIGWLQWQMRSRGWKSHPQEPILRDYHNIQCRDAVLAYDSKEPLLDGHGLPVTRWDGEATKINPATGEPVPDESARVPVYRYLNPRKAEWPEVEYIVGNPPFLGKVFMPTVLGEGYVAGLRQAYKSDVPDGADFVFYWWFRAAREVASGRARRFGLVSTNSITQVFSNRVVDAALNNENPIHLSFAIADHPWSTDGAAVRIAMTVGEKGPGIGVLAEVTSEVQRSTADTPDVTVSERVGVITSDLTIGVRLSSAEALRANERLASMGPALGSRGFLLTTKQRQTLIGTDGESLLHRIRPILNGRDILYEPRGAFVIDLHGIESEEELRAKCPATWQWLHERVYPERNENRDVRLKNRWWLFRRSNDLHRAMLVGLDRFVITVETAKFRTFFFEPSIVLGEHGTISFGFDDAYFLGVMSSRIHVSWSLARGGTLEDRPRYNKTVCFDSFPFPDPQESLKGRIRDLGEQLDAHRKRQQALHPDLTITGMYNVLEKLRAGEALTAIEKKIYDEGLVSVLKQIHDELDAAVFEAYGWPRDLTDEQILQRLVALNHERAGEEKRGLIRWLRPEFQNPSGAAAPTQTAMQMEAAVGVAEAPAGPVDWPDELPKQISAVRDLVGKANGVWSVDSTARSFKKAKKKQVESVLDSLAALGLLVSFDTTEGRRWRTSS